MVKNFTRWDSDSGGGYCVTIVATNKTDKPLAWYGYVELDGQIYTAWNFERQIQTDGTYRINGVDWNTTLKPGASTFSIGYCANR